MKAPAFQFYVRDWLCSRNVNRMTGEEVKAYLYLLCESWLEEPRGSLPGDDQTLALLSKLPIETWLNVRRSVMANFTLLEDGRWYNEKLLKISKTQEAHSNFGKKGGGNPNFVKGSPNPYYLDNYTKKDKGTDKGNNKGKDKPASASASATATKASKEEEQQATKKPSLISEEEFLATLKASPGYNHVNVPAELSKMDTWLLAHPGRKKTRKFVVSWLNRIEVPLQVNGQKSESITDSWDRKIKEREERKLNETPNSN